jgi:hypothetical protein
VALQSDGVAESKELKNPIISDIDLTLTGGVTFNFRSEVDPSLVLYKNARKIENSVDNAEVNAEMNNVNIDNMEIN